MEHPLTPTLLKFLAVFLGRKDSGLGLRLSNGIARHRMHLGLQSAGTADRLGLGYEGEREEQVLCLHFKKLGYHFLQCVSFCCATKWISYMYTYIPSLLKPPSHPLLLNPSRSSQSSQLSFLLCLHFGLSYWVVKPCMELREIREEAGLGGE